MNLKEINNYFMRGECPPCFQFNKKSKEPTEEDLIKILSNLNKKIDDSDFILSSNNIDNGEQYKQQ